MKKIFEKLLIGILIVILLFVIYLKFFVKVNYIKLFGYSFFIVKTGSMEPTIKVDELIIVKEKKNYNKNDIITFSLDGIIVTHRIIEQNKETYITKGDYNNENDLPITNENILGKVIFHSELLGKIMVNYINLIILFIIFFCFIDLSFKRRKKKLEEK